MRLKKPLQDKIILIDILLGFVIVGSICNFIQTPIWCVILLVVLSFLFELLSRLIRQTQITVIWKLIKEIVEKGEKND